MNGHVLVKVHLLFGKLSFAYRKYALGQMPGYK